MPTMTLCIGLPGSGKSFKAAKLAEKTNAKIFSTDDYWFLNDPTVYAFDFKKIKEAHRWNQERTEREMERGERDVIIDNTNLTNWERAVYLALAEEYGYDVDIAVSDAPWAFDPEECAARNTHGVPLSVIENMLRKMEAPEFYGILENA